LGAARAERFRVRGHAPVLLLVVMLAGCAPSAARTFELEFPGRELVAPLVVIVEDRAGIVTGIGAGPGDAPDGVTQLPGRTDALVVVWLGGMCDKRATLTVDASFGGYTITEKTERANSCRLAGVGRSVVLQLGRPVSAETVEFISGIG
jgi:hypothetical protein